MKHSTKRVLSFALALVLILSICVPAFAAGTISYHTGDAVIYLGAPIGTRSTIGVGLAWGNTSFNLRRADIRITGNSDVRLAGFRRNISSVYQEDIWNNSGKWEVSRNNYQYNYTAFISASKPGKATLSYVVNGKTYKMNLIIKAHVNPVKEVTLTGVNSGNSFASLTKNYATPQKNLKLNATTKSVQLRVTPSAGWKVTKMEISNLNTGEVRTRSNSNGWSSMVALSCGTLRVSNDYEVRVSLWNPSVGFTSGFSYFVHGASA